MRGEWLAGAAFGASATWALDSESGRRRRAALRDGVTHAALRTSRSLAAAWWDLVHVVNGRVAGLRTAGRRERADDRTVNARLRAVLGRYVSNPHAIEIDVQDGVGRLHGAVLADEVDGMLDALLSVRGLRGLENRLEIHESADHVPALQGGPLRPPRTGWRPALRLVGGSVGTGLLGVSFWPTRARWLFGTAGTALMVRAIMNRPLRQLVGLGSERDLVEVHKTLDLEVPIERVFSFLTNFENYPLFMEHMLSVEPLAEGGARWKLRGPAKLPFDVETELVDYRPNELISWRSVTGRPRHEARIRFLEKEQGTRLALRFAWTPPAGLAGHGLGMVTGNDLKHVLDRDLVRLKSLLEVGRTTLRGQTVVLET